MPGAGCWARGVAYGVGVGFSVGIDPDVSAGPGVSVSLCTGIDFYLFVIVYVA